MQIHHQFAHKMINKKGQVWIETVLYTLIGLALIAIVLTFVTPKINESRDKVLLEQTLISLNDLDSLVSQVSVVPGNTRKLLFTMKKGTLEIDTDSNKINFKLKDSNVLFSEPGVPINIGRIEVLTTEGQKTNQVKLTLSYDSKNLTYNGVQQSNTTFSAASTPYSFLFSNKGNINEDGISVIDITESTGAN